MSLGSSKEPQPGMPDTKAKPIIYEPQLTEILGQGSTSLVARIRPGLVVKYPRYMWWHAKSPRDNPFVQDAKRAFEVEAKILDLLGTHIRIIHYLGISDDPRGLLFEEATGSHGNLQTYIDQHQHHHDITLTLRLEWCLQAAEAIQYIHRKDVIHSDLRPENFLLHSDSKENLNLVLCDFGGSKSDELEIDTEHLPDSGFFNPAWPWVPTKAVDIFSLGSVFYTIMTGHWPYKSPGPFESSKEKYEYEEMVDDIFSRQKFPPVDELYCGSITQGCWTERYSDVSVLVQDLACLLAEMNESNERSPI
ncbi:hypothetical protein N7456_011366 [Penicillium angulare]|uniref:EKC/KEOPS complex subunit BUD32 n=1 Tax=Penicillium angulare TaxID=116970 RepID=A0A9W9K001_9EURO|nr:hypothetical protein N7456_011366 [Penicillium angulare]